MILYFAKAFAIDMDATEDILEHMIGIPVHVRGE
jgi:hypothetical protein